MLARCSSGTIDSIVSLGWPTQPTNPDRNPKQGGGGGGAKESFVPVGGKTFEKAKLLAKPLKVRKKIQRVEGRVQSWGLSISEKASSAKVLPRPPLNSKASGRRAPTTSAAGDDSGYGSAHAIDLFALSASERGGQPT
jgi:hypothetical protein